MKGGGLATPLSTVTLPSRGEKIEHIHGNIHIGQRKYKLPRGARSKAVLKLTNTARRYSLDVGDQNPARRFSEALLASKLESTL